MKKKEFKQKNYLQHHHRWTALSLSERWRQLLALERWWACTSMNYWNFLTIKNGVGFDESFGKWALLAFSEKNRSCKLIAASKVDFFIATPMNLKMFEQIWLEYFVTPVTKWSNSKQQPMSRGSETKSCRRTISTKCFAKTAEPQWSWELCQ